MIRTARSGLPRIVSAVRRRSFRRLYAREMHLQKGLKTPRLYAFAICISSVHAACAAPVLSRRKPTPSFYSRRERIDRASEKIA
jgi:hypothetical protein